MVHPELVDIPPIPLLYVPIDVSENAISSLLPLLPVAYSILPEIG